MSEADDWVEKTVLGTRRDTPEGEAVIESEVWSEEFIRGLLRDLNEVRELTEDEIRDLGQWFGVPGGNPTLSYDFLMKSYLSLPNKRPLPPLGVDANDDAT